MEILTTLEPFWYRYDIFFYAAILSSIAAGVKEHRRIHRWSKQIITSFFVSLTLGIVVLNLTDLNKELIFVSATIAGYFAIELLRELKEVIDTIGETLSEFFRKKLGLDSKDKE